jgi:hypothetical protein
MICVVAFTRREHSAIDSVRRLLFVQSRSAGVGGRRARSRVNAGVVWCPGCRPLIGHFIGRVLRDTLRPNTWESASYGGKGPVGFA